MKFFAILLVAILAINNSLSQTSLESLRIQNEVNQLFQQVETQVLNDANNLQSDIENRYNQYYALYRQLVNLVGGELAQLGSPGEIVAARLNSDANSLIASLQSAVFLQNLQSQIIQILSNLETQYLNPLRQDANEFVSAISANPSAASCWHSNKSALESLIKATLLQVQSVISSDTSQLDAKIQGLANTVQNAVTIITNTVESQCGNNGSCYLEYVGF